jgi:hypothetical protein
MLRASTNNFISLRTSDLCFLYDGFSIHGFRVVEADHVGGFCSFRIRLICLRWFPAPNAKSDGDGGEADDRPSPNVFHKTLLLADAV